MKYCVRFSTELYPKLSEIGKVWLLKARQNLQMSIEGGLSEKPALELSNDKFKKFAFSTHADAYWNAGLHDLPFGDKVQIGLTPDLKEWVDFETWKQAGDVAGREVSATAGDAVDAIKRYFWKIFK